MAKFVFTLESVLRHRTHAERERMRELALAQAEMTRLQQELKALNDSMQASATDMKANHLTGPIDVAFLAAHRRYTVAMQRKGLSLVQEMARQQAKKTVRPERDTAVATGKKGDLGDLAPTPDAAKPAAFGVLVRKGTSYD